MLIIVKSGKLLGWIMFLSSRRREWGNLLNSYWRKGRQYRVYLNYDDLCWK
jgi:hypothetical protein